MTSSEQQKDIRRTVPISVGDLDVSVLRDGTVAFGIYTQGLQQTTFLSRDRAIAFSKNIISAIDEYEKGVAESSVARDLL